MKWRPARVAPASISFAALRCDLPLRIENIAETVIGILEMRASLRVRRFAGGRANLRPKRVRLAANLGACVLHQRRDLNPQSRELRDLRQLRRRRVELGVDRSQI